MKTWEVIQKWNENPDIKFRNLESGEIWTIGLSGNIVAVNKNGIQLGQRYINKLTIPHEWEEVKEPVTWQEAIQAWIDRKDFKVVMPNGVEYRQRAIFRLGYLENLDGLDKSNFTVDMFLNGKFYIED